MAEEETVQIDFEANDKITPKLSKMEKAVGKFDQRVNAASSRFTGMLGQSAMFGAFFGLGSAIAGAKNYIGHLDRISDLTGIAADRVGGISNALQGAGVSAEGVDSVFNSLVKKGAKVAEGNKTLIKLGKKYGITIKQGPEEALLGVSKLLEKGKINAGGLQRIMGISSGDAADMTEALSQGPAALKAQFSELTKKNAAFNEGAMAGMQEYQNASSRIGVSWNRMTAGIMIKLAPALTKLATKFEGSIESWTAGAEKFGNFLVKHMDKIIAMAKTYAKIMLVNAAVQKLGGGGIVALGGKAIGAVAKRRGVMAAAAGGAAPGIAGLLKSFLPAFQGLRPIITGLLRLTPIGGVIMVIVAAVKALGENFNGITTRLKTVFGSVLQTIGRIGSKIFGMFSGDSPLGKFFGGVGYAFLEVVEKLGRSLAWVLELVEKIAAMVPQTIDISKAGERMKEAAKIEAAYRKRGALTFGGQTQMEKNIASMRAKVLAGTWGVDSTTQAKAASTIPKPDSSKAAGAPTINQDFRGSRFDIKQAFAEGYDPDRIAVAFSQDVAALGERRLQSGFAPLFSVRT